MINHPDFAAVNSYIGRTTLCDLEDFGEDYEPAEDGEGGVLRVELTRRPYLDDELMEICIDREMDWAERSWEVFPGLEISLDAEQKITDIDILSDVNDEHDLYHSIPEDAWNTEDLRMAEEFLADLTQNR